MTEPYNCRRARLPDEPEFVLLARDPNFAHLVRQWSDERERRIVAGERPSQDLGKVVQARILAGQGAEWRRKHMTIWRDHPTPEVSRARTASFIADALATLDDWSADDARRSGDEETTICDLLHNALDIIKSRSGIKRG